MIAISIFSIAQLSQAIFEIPTGIYSDKIGRVTCLKIGSLASVFAVIFYAIGQAYWILLVGAIFEGICRALFNGNNDALLYESLAENDQQALYHHNLGTINSWLEFSGWISAVISGIIAFKSFSLLLWLSVIPQIVCLWISFGFIEPLRHKEHREGIYLHLKEALLYYKNNIRLRDLSLAGIIEYGIGEASWSFQSAFYTTVLPLWAVGFAMSLNALISTIGFRLSGKILNKIKALNIIIINGIYYRVVYVSALLYPTVFSPFMIAISSLLYGPGEVAKNTLLQKEFTDKQRATMASINSLIGSCFFALFAILIGMIADRYTSVNALLFAQICLLPAFILYIKVFRSDKREKQLV